MKRILLIFILIFNFVFTGYSITFQADENFLKQYFSYDKKSSSYVFNMKKFNTLSFNTLKMEDNLFVIQTIIRFDEILEGLKEVQFNNKVDTFVIPKIDLMHAENSLVFIGFNNIDNIDKLIDFFYKGNVYLEYVTETDTNRYKINNKTCKIFSEILKYNYEKQLNVQQ